MPSNRLETILYTVSGAMKILQDLWIMDPTGAVLFKRVFEEKINEQLFGGFMSALNTFASQIDQNGLSSFDIGNKKFILLKKDNLFFISNFDSNVNPKRASKELEDIAQKFLSAYPVDILTWDGDVKKFEGFDKKIQDSLEDVIGNFQKAFW